MPLSVVKRLSLGELTPTAMSLQRVDRSMAQREGILEDVLVKVGRFIFPTHFVVIDIEEDKKIPLLLGGPFLTTGAALIDVKRGEPTFRVGTEEVHFNLNQCLKQHDVEQAHCMKTDSVNFVCKKLNNDLMNDNSFDDYISSSIYDDNFEKEKIVAEIVLSLNTENLSREAKFQVEENSSKGLVLKELPKHLKYAFLGEERSKPVIIEANLTVEKKKKSGENFKKTSGGYCVVSRRTESDQPIHFSCIKSLWRKMKRLQLNIRGG